MEAKRKMSLHHADVHHRVTQAREDMTNMKVKQKTNVSHLRIMVDMNIQESFLFCDGIQLPQHVK
jgi:hypothetical protein